MSEPVCPRVGKLFGGCRFEARFDTPIMDRASEAFGSLFRSTTIEAVPGDPPRMRIVESPPPMKTYVRDVCRTCGRTIERQESAA